MFMKSEDLEGQNKLLIKHKKTTCWSLGIAETSSPLFFLLISCNIFMSEKPSNYNFYASKHLKETNLLISSKCMLQ